MFVKGFAVEKELKPGIFTIRKFSLSSMNFLSLKWPPFKYQIFCLTIIVPQNIFGRRYF